MTIEHIDDIDICVDCVQVNANGIDALGDNTEWVGFLPEWSEPNIDIAPLARCSGDHDGEPLCEGHFSWSPCQGCGSGLGGDRYCYAVYRIVASEVQA